jgi:hypothetical protein
MLYHGRSSTVHRFEAPRGCAVCFLPGSGGFLQTQFPGQTGMFDGRKRRCARSTVMTSNQHHIGFCFGYAGCYGSDTSFRNQLSPKCVRHGWHSSGRKSIALGLQWNKYHGAAAAKSKPTPGVA